MRRDQQITNSDEGPARRNGHHRASDVAHVRVLSGIPDGVDLAQRRF
jgi:hypothetical protein